MALQRPGPLDNCPLPHCLSSPEEELELQLEREMLDHASRMDLGKPPAEHPPWEDELASKIRQMTVDERRLMLKTICFSLQDDSACVGRRKLGSEAIDAFIQDLLMASDTAPGHSLQETISFHLFGLLLQESPGSLMAEHLPCLLELSHQGSGQREGMALAVGIASTSHLEEVWIMLEHLGQRRCLKPSFPDENSQPEASLHWKWSSSTMLLCFGHMAMRAKAKILPWVDNIMSRMVYYFSSSSYVRGHLSGVPGHACMCHDLMRCLSVGHACDFVATETSQLLLRGALELVQIHGGLVHKSVEGYWVTMGLSIDFCTLPAHGQDSVLKVSFLSATSMLAKVLKFESSTQDYRFTQIPELVQCLLSILQKERNILATLLRQKIILVILELSTLRPHLKPMVKSRILQTCLQSLYPLPPMEMKISVALPKPVPDVMMLYNKTMQALDQLLQQFISENETMDEIYFLLQGQAGIGGDSPGPSRQHTESWLQSEHSHERKRVVQSIFLMLQYVVELNFTDCATPSRLGRYIGLLTLLWRDQDEFIQSHSRHCVYFLLQILLQQRKPTKEESIYLTKMRSWESKDHRDWELLLYNLVQALDKNLTVAQHTQLVLTFLQGLARGSHLCSDLASELLYLVFEGPGIRKEQVPEILHSLFQELPGIVFRDVQLAMVKAVTTLGTQHTQETVEVVLALSPPNERQTLILWRALGDNARLARKVVTVLYMKMSLRPDKELVRPNQQAQLVSVLAMRTIYELLYTPPYKPTVRWAFAGILLGLLTELHYLFDLGCVQGISVACEPSTLEQQPLSPSRTCLEALKGLFWTTNYWEVFSYLTLAGGWELFERQDTFTEGVTLLARAMAQYNCEMSAVLGQVVISLKSSSERDNVVAIFLLVEFLTSQELTQYVSHRALDSFLSLGLRSHSRLVQAMSLKGLSSLLMQPKKVRLLESRAATLLNRLQKPDPQDPRGLMQILGYVLHSLGPYRDSAFSLKIAQHLLLLFEDDRAEVREGAILLFGDIIYSRSRKHCELFKSITFQALVPLLFHLADPCPRVVAKAKFTFLRCAILLHWEFRKELFCTLAWGHGKGAQNDVFIYMMESNFGNFNQFLTQAFQYLGSPHQNLKRAAMKFIGVLGPNSPPNCPEGLMRDYFTELCFYLKREDLSFIRKCLTTLNEDEDSCSRRFYHNLSEGLQMLAQYVV
ncbi:maestro heat-like repeat family member 5 [Tenrec ecaudatus]|uniref:maestro heat-like repeat family member 5 n=1 Tax=Tenrec ecaudatus TaxID=94439 RepID=UPI003F5A1E14